MYYTGFNPFAPPKPAPKEPPPKPNAPENKGPPAPARMAILSGGGREAIILMPQNYAKAVDAAVHAFEIPNTFVARLAVRKATGDMPAWLGRFSDQDMMFVYEVAGKPMFAFGES